MRFFILLSLLFFNSLQAEDIFTAEEKKKINGYTKKLKLKNDEKLIQQSKGIEIDVTKNAMELKNFQISFETKKIPLSSGAIIPIDLHPKHFTKVFFPTECIVLKSRSAADLKNNNHFLNRIEYRPKEDFIESSISVTFNCKEKNYDLTLIASRYNVGDNRNIHDNVFYPKIQFTLQEPLTPKEVLKEYRKNDPRNEFPTLNITIFRVDGLIYNIKKIDNPGKELSSFNKPNIYAKHYNKIYAYKITY